jgi:tetratricopeptide (TPR) repeat protein
LPAPYNRIAAELQQGRFGTAEHQLASILQKNPNDSRALSWMAVVLDAEKRYRQAERYYNRALLLVPHSVFLLNNLGHHHLVLHRYPQACTTFMKVLSIDPENAYALLQLTQSKVEEGNGKAALSYLSRLPARQQASSEALLLKGQALYETGRRNAAMELLEHLEQSNLSNAKLNFSIGMILVRWRCYSEAEQAFEHALRTDPTSFNAQYNLGLAAIQAGDLQRAEQVFSLILRERPKDVDSLAYLAFVFEKQGQSARALMLLMRAQAIAPDRPDILLRIAQLTERLGLYGDTAVAYDRYLKLRPNDAVARRERGFSLASSGELEKGLADLQWYVARNPKDADGLYELAICEAPKLRGKALEYLDRAIKEKPSWLAPHYTRAALNYQEGNEPEAHADLQFILKSTPDNVRVLDLLGQVELRSHEFQSAAQTFSRALHFAPKDHALLVHYSQVLMRLGRTQEAARVLDELKSIGSDAGHRPVSPWVFAFFNLPPAKQRAEYVAGLKGEINLNPQNPNLRIALGKLLLSEGKTQEALASYQYVLRLTSDPQMISQCGRDLLNAGLYQTAGRFLASAVAANPASAGLILDLAMAEFHSEGPHQALRDLERVPANGRNRDYYLLKAEILEALHQDESAIKVVAKADSMGLEGKAPVSFYLDAAVLLLKHQHYRQALSVLQDALHRNPDHRSLLLGEAVAYSLLRDPVRAEAAIAKVAEQWPDWSRLYLVKGIISQKEKKIATAVRSLKIARALGSQTAITDYFLAQATLESSPQDLNAAYNEIQQALNEQPKNPYFLLLAGKVAKARKDYRQALDFLRLSAELEPDLVETHAALNQTYRALGNLRDAELEVAKISQLRSRRVDVGAEAFLAQALIEGIQTQRSEGRFPYE